MSVASTFSEMTPGYGVSCGAGRAPAVTPGPFTPSLFTHHSLVSIQVAGATGPSAGGITTALALEPAAPNSLAAKSATTPARVILLSTPWPPPVQSIRGSRGAA